MRIGNTEIPDDSAIYLGDGVYGFVDQGIVCIATDRGGVWHWIALEPEVMNALVRFSNRYYKEPIE